MGLWGSDIHVTLRPKRRRWFTATWVIALVSLVLFGGVSILQGWSSGDAWGLGFGVLATALLVLDGLYALRRRLLIWPLHRGQRWLQAHIYGGALTGLFVLIHAGFRWPAGTFGWLLLTLSLLTTLSGLVGVAIQKSVPVALTSGLGVEAIYERIPGLIEDLRAEAQLTIADASETLRRFHVSHVGPALAGPSISWSYLVDLRSGRDRQLAAFDGLFAFLPEPDQVRAESLKKLVVRKRELEAHYTLQAALRVWLWVHVPAAMLLIGAVGAHVAAVWRF